MTGEELITRVVRTVQDNSYDEEVILDLLNEGLMEVAGRVRLPGLEVTADVDTVPGNHQAALPANYQHGLFDCQSLTTIPVRVLNSKRQIMAKYGSFDHSGAVRHVCAPAQNTLYYVPIPEVVDTLTLSYYRLPDTLTETGIPSCLPAEFHKILHSYACFEIFDEIEDGMEGAKVNTDRHEGKFERLVGKLKLRYKEGQSYPRPPVVKGSFL